MQKRIMELLTVNEPFIVEVTITKELPSRDPNDDLCFNDVYKGPVCGVPFELLRKTPYAFSLMVSNGEAHFQYKD